jgi:hypothetical protein
VVTVTKGDNMPLEEKGCDTQSSPPVGLVGRSNKEQISKQRYVELTQMAVRVAQELQIAGLQSYEICEFGRIMEKVIRLN